MGAIRKHAALNQNAVILSMKLCPRASDSLQSSAKRAVSRRAVSIGRKLEAQEKLARDGLDSGEAANAIAGFRQAVATAETIELVRLLESRAAHAYWGAWRKVPVDFPKCDLHRVPDHWRSFGARVSPLTGSPRLAATPVNSVLNYLYAVLEAETRLAVAALGLDPGLGVLHVDTPSRDSLACDVMEPIRPHVDAYVLRWITHETLRREWFFEQRDGSCRLMGSFAVRLSETAPTWANAVAPVAERVARTLWSTAAKLSRSRRPPTRLTQDHRREARGLPAITSQASPTRPESFCRDCGVQVGPGRTRCVPCNIAGSTVRLVEAAKQGRIAAQSDQAQGLRAETQRQHARARAGWNPSDLPDWLNEETYRREIQPRLKGVALSALASALGISIPYAVDVRKGRRVPHPRHWKTLAELVNLTPNTDWHS
jgi:hypothetical protein